MFVTLCAIKQTVRMRESVCVFVNRPLCVFVCVAESVANKAGSLTSHCDPDSKCSAERERERERQRQRGKSDKRETGKGKEDRRETGREGETNYEKPNHRGTRE